MSLFCVGAPYFDVSMGAFTKKSSYNPCSMKCGTSASARFCFPVLILTLLFCEALDGTWLDCLRCCLPACGYRSWSWVPCVGLGRSHISDFQGQWHFITYNKPDIEMLFDWCFCQVTVGLGAQWIKQPEATAWAPMCRADNVFAGLEAPVGIVNRFLNVS